MSQGMGSGAGRGKAELQALLQKVLDHVDRSPKKAAQVLAQWVEGHSTRSKQNTPKKESSHAQPVPTQHTAPNKHTATIKKRVA